MYLKTKHLPQDRASKTTLQGGKKEKGKRKKRDCLYGNLLLKKTHPKLRTFSSYHISETPAYHRAGKQLSLWRSKRSKFCSSGCKGTDFADTRIPKMSLGSSEKGNKPNNLHIKK